MYSVWIWSCSVSFTPFFFILFLWRLKNIILTIYEQCFTINSYTKSKMQFAHRKQEATHCLSIPLPMVGVREWVVADFHPPNTWATNTEWDSCTHWQQQPLQRLNSLNYMSNLYNVYYYFFIQCLMKYILYIKV